MNDAQNKNAAHEGQKPRARKRTSMRVQIRVLVSKTNSRAALQQAGLGEKESRTQIQKSKLKHNFSTSTMKMTEMIEVQREHYTHLVKLEKREKRKQEVRRGTERLCERGGN